jgi:hypothetical protein
MIILLDIAERFFVIVAGTEMDLGCTVRCMFENIHIYKPTRINSPSYADLRGTPNSWTTNRKPRRISMKRSICRAFLIRSSIPEGRLFSTKLTWAGQGLLHEIRYVGVLTRFKPRVTTHSKQQLILLIVFNCVSAAKR